MNIRESGENSRRVLYAAAFWGLAGGLMTAVLLCGRGENSGGNFQESGKRLAAAGHGADHSGVFT